MTARDPKKFDPARAPALDAPEREEYLPTGRILDTLALAGDEHVVDYGAGSGRLARALAARLPEGRVTAVDESEEMAELLRERLADVANATAVLIAGNQVPFPDAGAERVVAVSLLHEVRGESALGEMRRLLAPGGWLLVVDWDRERPSPTGPPLDIRYGQADATGELQDAGFAVDPLALDLPYHFALRARS